ncbi:MAG: hypothetical protein AB7G28_02075 [Pirellulales bacterium]
MSSVTLRAPEKFAAALVRRGLPVEYAQRAAAELADHRQDLVRELCATGLDEDAAAAEAALRLGNDRLLLKRTIREYQARFWVGRWPLLTFLILPVPVLILSFAATLFGLFCLTWLVGSPLATEPVVYDGVISSGEYSWNVALRAIFMFALPAGVLSGLFWLARRAAMSWRWIGVTACVLALAVSSARWGFPDPVLHNQKLGYNGSPLPADHIGLSIGMFFLNVPSSAARIWYGDVLDQTLFPLAIAALLLFRMARVSRRAEQLVVADG